MTRPKTLVLVDSRTSEPVWIYEIPAGKRIVTRFSEGENAGDETEPDFLLWDLFDQGRPAMRLENRVPVPPADARRWEVYLRPMPEVLAMQADAMDADG